jgi:hypothetical protein
VELDDRTWRARKDYDTDAGSPYESRTKVHLSSPDIMGYHDTNKLRGGPHAFPIPTGPIWPSDPPVDTLSGTCSMFLTLFDATHSIAIRLMLNILHICLFGLNRSLHSTIDTSECI